MKTTQSYPPRAPRCCLAVWAGDVAPEQRIMFYGNVDNDFVFTGSNSGVPAFDLPPPPLQEADDSRFS